jgi:ParB family chromosome partitioning protein
MAEGRRGLGRGLSALLGDAAASLEGDGNPPIPASISELPIEVLRRNPEQPRRSFPESELEELSESVREKGVLQPILVRPAPGAAGEYQIVAGERRWRAAQRAGLRDVPVLVRDLSDLEVLEIGIVENIQREDLKPIDEALGYKALMDRFGRTQEALAQTVGKSRSHVANMVRLLSLPEDVQNLMSNGSLSAGHGRALLGFSNPREVARDVVAKGLSVRQVEELSRRAQDKSDKPKPKAVVSSADSDALEQDLSDALGLKVQVTDHDGKGEVRIRYLTAEQLDEICRRLSRS